MSMKNPNYPIGNRTRGITACSSCSNFLEERETNSELSCSVYNSIMVTIHLVVAVC
jgi:hypothetical protein